MLHESIVQDREGYRWTLMQYGDAGANVLARSCTPLPDAHGCEEAMSSLSSVPRERVRPVRAAAGWWGWTVYDGDDRPVAASPAVFHDPAQCLRAFADLRLALQGLSGAHDRLIMEVASQSAAGVVCARLAVVAAGV